MVDSLVIKLSLKAAPTCIIANYKNLVIISSFYLNHLG